MIFSIRGYLKKLAIEIRGIKKPTPREPYNKKGIDLNLKKKILSKKKINKLSLISKDKIS